MAVGPWQIDPRPYDSGPTWQDHRASREDLPGEHRRIRIYLYERERDPERQESVRHAAQREFRAARGIQHPGLLVPGELLDHQMGLALVISTSTPMHSGSTTSWRATTAGRSTCRRASVSSASSPRP